jgi:hypothetical protein
MPAQETISPAIPALSDEIAVIGIPAPSDTSATPAGRHSPRQGNDGA